MRRLIAALFIAATAGAGTVEDAADAVLAAASDRARIDALAARTSPDPWRVADELLARGETGAAALFAASRAKLAAYVKAHGTDDPALRGTLREMVARSRAKQYAEGLAIPTGAKKDTIPAIRIAYLRGYFLRRSKRYREGFDWYLRAADAAERIGWRRRAGRALHWAGICAYTDGDRRRTLVAWKRCAAIERARGPSPQLVDALSNLGTAHYGYDDYAHALPLYEEAIALAGEKKLPSLHSNAGSVNRLLGNASAALAHHRTARTLYEKAGNRAGAARATHDIGAVHWSRRESLQALAHFEQARQLHEQAQNRAGVARALRDIGVVHIDLGSHRRAVEALEHSLKLSPDASTLDILGLAYSGLGRYADALRAHDRALAIFEKRGRRAQVARALTNSGVVYLRLRDADRAWPLIERALEIQTALGDRDALGNLANLMGAHHFRAGKLDEALALFERARAAGAEDALFNIAKVHEERGDFARALACLEGIRGGGASMQLARGNLQIKTGRAKQGRATLERALPRAREEEDPDTEAVICENLAVLAGRREEWQAAVDYARQAVAAMRTLVRGLDQEGAALARDRWATLFSIGARAARAANDVDAALFFLESGRANALLETLQGGAELRATALPDELLLAESHARQAETNALHRFRAAHERRKRKELRSARDELTAARATRAAAVARIQREAKGLAGVLYPKPASTAAVQRVLAPGDALVVYGMFERESLAVVLTRTKRRVVLIGDDPIGALALPAGTRRLIVSPHGALTATPFAKLTELPVALVPSATTYVFLKNANAARGKGVLALGDPAQEPRLPAAKREAEAIGDEVLTGDAATRANLERALAARTRWRAVHLACHGTFDERRPLQSSLLLTGQPLTVLDIFRIRVPADAVVLSACETARGKLHAAEGLFGFPRAFMLAGAPRVIVSLWKVDDAATHALMTKFYELWRTHETATALREAQAFVAAHERWKDPRFWAAWQLWGLAD